MSATPTAQSPAFPIKVKEVLARKVWQFGDNLFLTRSNSPENSMVSGCGVWPDGKGRYFLLTTQPTSFLLEAVPPSNEPDVVEMYNDETRGAIWKIGAAFLSARHHQPGVALEHITLDTLANIECLSFTTPTHLYNHVGNNNNNNIYFLAQSDLPGVSLSRAFGGMSQILKDKIIGQVANAHSELAEFRWHEVCGVGEERILEPDMMRELFDRHAGPVPDKLEHGLNGIGLDVTDIVFAHNYMCPSCITVDPATGDLLGIGSWSYCGFVPKEWVRSKLRTNKRVQGLPYADWTDLHRLE
jgi:hypothetical protein